MHVPVADEEMPIPSLREAFPADDIRKHFIAWIILSRAFEGTGDRYTLRHITSPAAGWHALVDTYSVSTLGAKVQCLQPLTPQRVKPGTNPIPAFAAMFEDVHNLPSNGSDIEDKIVCSLILRALPDEYNVFRKMLEREREKLTIDRLRTESRAHCDLQKGEESPSSRWPDSVFLASRTRWENSKRGGKCGTNQDGGIVARSATIAKPATAVRVVIMGQHGAVSLRSRGTSNTNAPNGSAAPAVKWSMIQTSAPR